MVIPLLCNGSARIRLLVFGLDMDFVLLDHRLSPVQLGGPFGFCAFALLAPRPLGSLEIALKHTRPRLRFCYIVGQYSMTEEAGCQEGDLNQLASGKKAFLLLLTISRLELAIFLLWYICWL